MLNQIWYFSELGQKKTKREYLCARKRRRCHVVQILAPLIALKPEYRAIDLNVLLGIKWYIFFCASLSLLWWWKLSVSFKRLFVLRGDATRNKSIISCWFGSSVAFMLQWSNTAQTRRMWVNLHLDHLQLTVWYWGSAFINIKEPF